MICYNSRKGGKLSKKNNKYQLWAGIALIIVAIILLGIVMVNMMKGDTTGDMKIGGEATVTGMVCTDTQLLHPSLSEVPVISHKNTITMNFQNNSLSSISLVYEGVYASEQQAKSASYSANANYNITLTDDYHEGIDIFSDHFSTNGTKMQLVQTARDISKINTNTVTYFLLDKGTSIARSLEGLKKQYDAKGFSCEISE